eukprot:scaffold6446_cov104-Isochrysis_galbana.AAC.24
MGASSMCGMGTSSAAEPRPKPRLLSWWKVMQMRTGCSSSRLKYCSRSGAPYRSSALVEAESRRPRCLRVRGTTFRGMTPSVDARQSAPTGAGSSYLAALSSRIRLGMRAAKRKSSRACTSVGSAANSSSSSRHETYSHQSTAPPRARERQHGGQRGRWQLVVDLEEGQLDLGGGDVGGEQRIQLEPHARDIEHLLPARGVDDGDAERGHVDHHDEVRLIGVHAGGRVGPGLAQREHSDAVEQRHVCPRHRLVLLVPPLTQLEPASSQGLWPAELGPLLLLLFLVAPVALGRLALAPPALAEDERHRLVKGIQVDRLRLDHGAVRLEAPRLRPPRADRRRLTAHEDLGSLEQRDAQGMVQLGLGPREGHALTGRRMVRHAGAALDPLLPERGGAARMVDDADGRRRRRRQLEHHLDAGVDELDANEDPEQRRPPAGLVPRDTLLAEDDKRARGVNGEGRRPALAGPWQEA